MSIYFEILSVRTFVIAGWRYARLRGLLFSKSSGLYFFDASRIAEVVLIPMLQAFGIASRQLDFEMRNIKDDRGELLRLRIHRQNFSRPKGTPGFSDWSSVIDEFDPFRHGMAANRSNYLAWLVQGFEQGRDRCMVMAEAAERYAKQWGDDRIYATAATYRSGACG